MSIDIWILKFTKRYETIYTSSRHIFALKIVAIPLVGTLVEASERVLDNSVCMFWKCFCNGPNIIHLFSVAALSKDLSFFTCQISHNQSLWRCIKINIDHYHCLLNRDSCLWGLINNTLFNIPRSSMSSGPSLKLFDICPGPGSHSERDRINHPLHSHAARTSQAKKTNLRSLVLWLLLHPV